MNKIAIIIGSTRPGRSGEAIAHWVYDIARIRNDTRFEIVDIADYNLPLLDEPEFPKLRQYQKAHTKEWSKEIASFDGYIFVTPEYNHATSGALKNAIDYLYYEWNNKAAGFVGYGAAGGVTAVESLRMIMAELQIAHVRSQVRISLYTDFENFKILKPASFQVKAANEMIDQVIAWSGALKILRKAEETEGVEEGERKGGISI